MKLIKQWKDTKYNVENYLYENKDGLKVLHTLNPQALDTYISFAAKAGSYFEKQLNVPNGTAHFLEHMLCNPNNVLKTDDEIDRFEFGNSKRPEILFNAGTGMKHIFLYGIANSKREEDLMKRITLAVTYPLEKFPKHISNERKTILAELQGDKKPEKNPELQFQKFALSNKIYTNDFSVIGEKAESIKKVNIQNLVTFYKSTFTIKNSIVSIQSPTEISKKMVEYVNKISERLRTNSGLPITIHPEVIENNKVIGYFANTEKNGIKTRLFFFKRNTWKELHDYNLEMQRILSTNLLHFVIFKELREKKGYIYGTRNYTNFFWNLQVRGIEIETDLDNFEKAIEKLFSIIKSEAIKFVHTQHGKKWLQNEISRYIYPHTQVYDEYYTEAIAINILEDYLPLEFEKAKEAAKKISAKDLERYLKENVSNMHYGVWVDSSFDLEIIRKKLAKIRALKDYV